MTVAELNYWTMQRSWGQPLVTHNRGDYAGVDGLVVISEG
jgi:hypothetical protein